MLGRFERQKARIDAKQRRHYLRLMQFTVEAVVDAQGRIMLPRHMAEIAGIGDEVTFVGAGNVIEMWDPARYENFIAGADDDFDHWLSRYL